MAPGAESLFAVLLVVSWLLAPVAFVYLLKKGRWRPAIGALGAGAIVWAASRLLSTVLDDHLRLWLTILVLPIFPIPYFIGFWLVAHAFDAAEPKRTVTENRHLTKNLEDPERLRRLRGSGLVWLGCAAVAWLLGALYPSMSNAQSGFLAAAYIACLVSGLSRLVLKKPLFGM